MLAGRVPDSADTLLIVLLKVVNDHLPLLRNFNPDIPMSCKALFSKRPPKSRSNVPNRRGARQWTKTKPGCRTTTNCYGPILLIGKTWIVLGSIILRRSDLSTHK